MPDQVAVSTNKNFDTPFIRINYSSLTTPNRWLDMDMSNLDSKVDQKSIGAGITRQFTCYLEFILVMNDEPL